MSSEWLKEQQAPLHRHFSEGPAREIFEDAKTRGEVHLQTGQDRSKGTQRVSPEAGGEGSTPAWWRESPFPSRAQNLARNPETLLQRVKPFFPLAEEEQAVRDPELLKSGNAYSRCVRGRN